uniref:Uncharacterized protein n=1 Tax=Populus trichocarpa TaxID=3694 RepID=A0A2K2ABD0_POPTR|eukprot:XP_024456492.1 probable protein S-acyltransferase 17 [Populus trichocarpa]
MDPGKVVTFVALINGFLVFTVAVELIQQYSITSDGVSCHSFSIFGYHANLCLTNTTTNETFKWEDYISWQRKLNEARVSAAALKASISGMSSEAKRPESICKSFFRRSPLEDSQVV